MKFRDFLTLSFTILFTLIAANTASAQQRQALLETFSGTSDPCSLSDQLDFQTAVKNAVSQEGSKVIHLNYFIGIQQNTPYNLDQTGGAVLGRLAGGNGDVIYTGAVDRQVFNNTGVRIDPANSSGSTSDWSSTIEADAGTAPEASVTLNFATLDKTDSQNQVILHADMTVTANTTISDSLIIRYAITQDNVAFRDSCVGPGVADLENDMVWYVSSSNSSNSNGNNYVICTSAAGLSAGQTVHVTWDHSIDMSDLLYEKAANMKLVVFLEDEGSAGSGNYYVANAAILKKDLDTLQAPAPTLSFDETHISNDTLTPGSTVDVYYNSTNLPGGVNAFYSLNGGTIWIPMMDSLAVLDSQSSGFSWTVPATTTTDGKIKLVAVGYPSITSTEIGTFSILVPPTIAFIEPQPGQKIQSGSTDTILWTKFAVTGATLQYFLPDPDAEFTVPHSLGHVTDTFFYWSVPDTSTRAVKIELVPDNDEAPSASVIDTIEKSIPQGVVANSITPSGLTITNIFPNPASNGEDIEVQYAEAQPKPVTVQLLDLLGRVMPENYTTDNLAFHLNTNSLAAGAYVVRLSDGTNVVSKRVEIVR